LEFCQIAVEGVTGLFSERALLCVEVCQRAEHMLIEIVSLSLLLCEGLGRRQQKHVYRARGLGI